MDMTALVDLMSNLIYPMQGIAAVYGIFLVVLIFRRINQKKFRSEAIADEFLNQVNEHLKNREFDEVVTLCDSPPYWSKAVPQLILIAMANRQWHPAKLRQAMSETFEREVLTELDYQMSWVNTVVKTAPMLGLQGTVLGMIAAFGKIAGKQATGVNPASLANDISFALITTAVGLMIAIPLVMCMASMQVRIGRLTDSVQHQIGKFLDQLELVSSRRK
ncbi:MULTISPECIES: MotA/TolQ/ExbB proton channel family protein [unclassified Schlesneria]|uniref:MotA/TolQ/ExbB proton channel family protein n=1 Tax=Schlesneria TaxID=656899 RepID=UPI002EF5499D